MECPKCYNKLEKVFDGQQTYAFCPACPFETLLGDGDKTITDHDIVWDNERYRIYQHYRVEKYYIYEIDELEKDAV